jgi:ATP-binding cassette, subfamily B, bacterial
VADFSAAVDEPEDQEERPRDRRTFFEVMEPEGGRGSWRELPRLLLDSFRLAWTAGPHELAVTASLQLLIAFGVAAQLFIGKAVLDAVLGAGDFADIVPVLAALIAITVAIDFAGAVEAEQSRVLAELVGRRALDRVLDVSTRVDLLAFESPDFYDRLRRAQAQGQFRSLQTVNGLLGLVGASVAAVGIVAALATIQPLLIPLVVFGFVPLWIVASRNTRDFYRFSFGMTPNERERGYLTSVMLEREAAKEVRAYQLAPFLRRRYDRLFDERMVELRALARRRTVRSLIGALTASAVTALAVVSLAALYINDRMDLAATGAAVLGLYQLTGRLRTLHFSAASLYEATVFIRDYTSFLEHQPIEARPAAALPPPQRFGGLEVDAVSFTYPGSGRPALDGVSLEIAQGEVIALVGENGSGKTTLAKIIAGLYPPERGRVLWDGVDAARYDPDELRRSVAVIFQDFARYLLPARENVGLGRHDRIDDFEAIVAAARRADADGFLSRLPEGYETMLGREFSGGWDLSIGQWQRVALARAFFRDAPLVILDEPTAALDARAESRLFERMRELLEGRSVVLISHRFSSVRTADRIYVLHGGQVVEHGSHEALMAEDGLYAELFTLQARAYLTGR